MISRINTSFIYVLELDKAVEFYRNKLGFKILSDIISENNRWVTLRTPGKPANQVMLIPVEQGIIFKKSGVKVMTELIKQKTFSFACFECENLERTYKQLRKKGVEFMMEPGSGFLGNYEAAFLDNSGNWFRLIENKNK